MSITSFIFYFFVLLQVLPEVLLCMLLQERKGISLSLLLCMNSNRSAGGGRRGRAWRVYTAGRGKNLGCYVMRGDRSDG